MVVLGAELEVAHDDRDLGAGDDQDEEDEEQEAKHVVELVQPDGGEDKEELDKHSACGGAPKGRTPPTTMEKAGLMYQTCSGTCLGIWLTRTGKSTFLRR